MTHAQDRMYSEVDHPRDPKGSTTGGQFTAKSSTSTRKPVPGGTKKTSSKPDQKVGGNTLFYDAKTGRGPGYGSRDGDSRVRQLQEALNRLGLTDAQGNKLKVDGKLGPKTTAAIKAMQRRLGVKADGRITPEAIEKLAGMKSLAKKAKGKNCTCRSVECIDDAHDVELGEIRAATAAETRALTGADASGYRGDGRTLFGHFGIFDEWAEIHDQKGPFLERNARGAWVDSLTDDRDRIKALYDHGKDPQLGNKPLGPFKVLEEDQRGGYYEIGLIKTSYNDDFVIPAAEAGLLGSSYRFQVRDRDTDEGWDHRPMRPTRWNPERLPERTILRAQVFELGPVTFPAYRGAKASIRSILANFGDEERAELVRELAAEVRLALDLTDLTGQPGARSAGGGDDDAQAQEGTASPPHNQSSTETRQLEESAFRALGVL